MRCAYEEIELMRAGDEPEPRAYPIQIVQFGKDLTLIALTSEVVVDYSLRLKRELGGDSAVWIAGYSNGYFGYIPSKRVLEEGGYEAAPWMPEIEERIVGKVHQMVRVLRQDTGR